MNTSMHYQRITVSIPDYLISKLQKRTPKRKVSSFVATLIEKELLEKPEPNTDEVKSFFCLRESLPKYPQTTILQAIKKGRS